MSSKAVSPTAQALRSSRLFSLPAAISPINSFQQKESESATAAYPIQQAIKTSSSSRARGDWGLKRALPLRSTNKGTNPVVRLNALDTREHITDYSSASDLTVTLSKFHELGLAVTTAEAKSDRATGRRPRSVFEDEIDNVDVETANSYSRASTAGPGQRRKDMFTANTRWKFGGPYLAQLTDGEFVDYLDRTLADKKGAFMAYLRESLAQKLSSEAKQRATERGQRGDTSTIRSYTSADITDAQLREYIQRLRKDFVANSELSRLLESFLDLPSTSTADGLAGWDPRYSETGPPSTHPSAGLSYLRSDAYMPNHPLLGPQKYKAPFEGRNLGTGKPNEQTYTAPFIGIAGLVAREPGSMSMASHLGGRLRSIPANDPATANEDKDIYPAPVTDAPQITSPETEGRSIGMFVNGGNRVWVSPQRVAVDSTGRIKVSTGWATASAVNVRTAAVLNPEAPKTFTRDRESYVFRPSAGFDARRPGRQGATIGEHELWGRR